MKKYFRFLVIFFVLSCWIPHIASAQVVNVPDSNLAAAVREALGLTPNAPITRQAMRRLTELDVEYVSDLTGLEHATQLAELTLLNHENPNLAPLTRLTNLTSLDLTGNGIRDITPLARLTNLTSLDLTGSEIDDFTPLTRLTNLTSLGLFTAEIDNKNLVVIARLTHLTSLGLGFNTISDVSPLSKLTNLTWLSLIYNNISDVSPLSKLTNLTWLAVRENPITDTSPLASLTKLKSVDVEITPPLPDPLPDDLLPDDLLPEDPLPEEPLPEEPPPSPEPQPEPEPLPLPTITAGQITFSELMFATSGGLFSQPQWIELFNNGPVGSEPVNLRGSRLVIEARDSEIRHRYSTIVFENLVIKPKWTVLLVTRGNRRNSGYLSEDRVYNLYDHSNVSSLGLRDNAVLPASGFALKLFAADDTLIDSTGNLDGEKRSKDTPMWELPAGWTEDRMRTSLIRRYEDGTALPGTEATSWVRAADVQVATNTYYGHKADIGNPGYRSGGPLPVELSHFSANRTDVGIIIEWTTASETDNAGFNILRSQTKDGSFAKVNPTLIPGAGTTAERQTYTWTDTAAKPNVAYYYRIEDVSFSGNRQPLATVRMRGHVSASDKLTTTWSELKVQD